MAEVHVNPMPEKIRSIPDRLRSGCPPIFTGGDPTRADRELALELWRALDVQNRRWYTNGGKATHFCGLPLTPDDLEGLRNTTTEGDSP